MLQKNLNLSSQQVSQSTISGTGTSINSGWPSTHSVNTVQMTGKHSVNQIYAVDTNHSQNKWIIDTGATDHITPIMFLLHDVQQCDDTLQLPNGDTTSITHVGNLILTPQLILTKVLCVPSFAYNLLSVSMLLQDTSYQVTFLANICYLQDHSWKTALERGKEENGLYMLIMFYAANVNHVLCAFCDAD